MHHQYQNFQKELIQNFKDDNDHTVFYNGLKRMLIKENIDLKHLKNFLINMPTKHTVDVIKEEIQELGITEDMFYVVIDKL